MNDMLKHKGYFGSVRYNDTDQLFHGKIEFIRDLVTYEGVDVKSLADAFKESVEEYLSSCKEQKKEPEKPFRGSFNVRPGTELHRRAALYAKEQGINLNQVIVNALKNYLPTAS